MTKFEFEELGNVTVTNEQYKVIEEMYVTFFTDKCEFTEAIKPVIEKIKWSQEKEVRANQKVVFLQTGYNIYEETVEGRLVKVVSEDERGYIVREMSQEEVLTALANDPYKCGKFDRNGVICDRVSASDANYNMETVGLNEIVEFAE